MLEISAENLPEVFVLNNKTEVIETDDLYMIGFPFGSQFSTNRDNPLVTISKGIISSKRLDVNDQVFLLQIDGDINPGNSGGLIVNRDGELVGVSVATVRKTNIGFAIPKSKVVSMLKGSIGNLRVTGEGKETKLIADKLDPFELITGALLIISEFKDKDTTVYLDENNNWKKINNPILSLTFKKKNDVFTSNINELPASEKKYLAQIAIKYKDKIIY